MSLKTWANGEVSRASKIWRLLAQWARWNSNIFRALLDIRNLRGNNQNVCYIEVIVNDWFVPQVSSVTLFNAIFVTCTAFVYCAREQLSQSSDLKMLQYIQKIVIQKCLCTCKLGKRLKCCYVALPNVFASVYVWTFAKSIYSESKHNYINVNQEFLWSLNTWIAFCA